jgi:alginate O-acetyltransferase complex protein AlgI
MLFNSIEFLLFLPTVFLLYWFVAARSLPAQNLLVLVASYVFYGWWDWRFLGLIALSTVVDYLAGLGMHRARNQSLRRLLLVASLATNLGLLGFFKYWNFFVDSWIAAWASVGISIEPTTAQIILPVGISFYTFQTLSYTIDIYRRRIEPTSNVIAFAAFVAFFPQLVAGPIERASNLLPQFLARRSFSYTRAAEGMRQIVWGLFKKVVIADQLAIHVDLIFSTWQTQPGAVLLLGTVFFAFQIYCDFSGYSDIAVGTARLFGFDLMANFRYPYFARDIAEFWRRWHISLSTWFRDYVYIPLGGSRGSKARTLRNILIVFTVSGFWHGANWTFVAWGALNAFYFLPFILLEQHRNYMDDAASGRILPSLREFSAILITFLAVCAAWVFFRAENLQDAFGYLAGMLPTAGYLAADLWVFLPALLLILALVSFEWAYRSKPFPLSYPAWPAWVRWSVYFGLLYSAVLASKKATEFIYFQF